MIDDLSRPTEPCYESSDDFLYYMEYQEYYKNAMEAEIYDLDYES